MRGKFIAIEGPDGSGKTLQQELLIERCTAYGLPVSRFEFPQYETSIFGKEVGKILAGEYGNIENIHPRILSVIYAADRWKASELINRALDQGNIVIANRYTLSNMAHQSARLPEEYRSEFLEYLETLEYHSDGFGIPKPDLYVHLDVPIKITQELILKKAKRDYLDGKEKDELEANVAHQMEAALMYKALSESNEEIVSIACCDEEGELYQPEIIHEAIWAHTSLLIDGENKEGRISKERE